MTTTSDARKRLAEKAATNDGVEYTPSEAEVWAAGEAFSDYNAAAYMAGCDPDRGGAIYAALVAAHAVAPEPCEDVAELVRLVEYALHICMNGERAPGGDETWAQFGRDAETYLRSRPATPTTKESPR